MGILVASVVVGSLGGCWRERDPVYVDHRHDHDYDHHDYDHHDEHDRHDDDRR